MTLKKLLIITTIILLASAAYTFAAEPDFTSFTPKDEVSISLPAFTPISLSQNEIIFKQNSTKYNSLDPKISATYFPGGRGANKLVIYTPSFGLHTGTNEFGTEAIVEGNTVTALSGADSTIPANGIVISGHGIAKNWITQNISVGSKIYINKDNNTITVYTTSESFTYEAKAKINEANSIIDYYKNSYPNYNYQLPQSHIQTAQNYLKMAENEKNRLTLQQYSKDAIDAANLAIRTALPYIKNELKGMWIRPTETTEEQIISTLDKIKANGFNSIFLETYFHGKTIFPSQTMNRYGFTIQNEQFEGFDPLKTWIKEAHKRDIKVHIWFQSFYVGNKPPEYCQSSILSVRPDWGNKIKKYADSPTATKSTSEHNGYFIDPANPEVQGFLMELLTEIVDTYHPDGINLDYIRYPNTTSANEQNSWGFTEYARNEFKEQSGIDPMDLTVSDVQWYDWNQYRRNKITNFVKQVGQLGKEKKVYISTVIFPDLASALATKQQDWRTWSAEGYINGFTPLFLTYDSSMLGSMMNDVMRVKAPSTDLFAGLFVTFMGGSSEDLIRQIYQTRRMFANGIILFDYAHTTPVYTSTLMAGAFNEGKRDKTVVASTKLQKKKQEKNQEVVQKQNRKVIQTTNSKGFWVFTK
ncbi:MAG: family 10 glycosylhydrolase [Muribaculaceae bacterium]|nr:family 10 glycosylhydrolase [Muribaculaceae bacterium]